MDLPSELRVGIEAALRGVGQAELRAAAAGLSDRYRAGHGASAGPPGGARYVASPAAAAAYAAYRMPATYAAVAAAMAAMAARMPGWAPRSLLDAGAGLGASLWAAAEVWDDLAAAELIESAPAMLSLGRQLAGRGGSPAMAGAAWRQADLTAPWRAERHDLATAAYVLGELPEAARGALVDALWAHSGHALLLVEPGTPAGWAIIRAARERLRAAGAAIIAPCPHQGACPLPEGDWCHFAQRIARSKIQRAAKGAELGYEDEKFAYVAVAREPGTPISARVLRRPVARPGRIELALCAPDGLRTETVTRSNRERWREARDAEWGDALP
ncbi:methyltransferase type 11 [Chloroflexales bacterium ZM16-3]|nr:methyltransferase type 11 [Chloroflexales bacterium ZM16-3]